MYPHLSRLQLGQGLIWGQDLTQKWVEMYIMLSGPSKARTPEAIGAGDRLGVPCQLLRTSIHRVRKTKRYEKGQHLCSLGIKAIFACHQRLIFLQAHRQKLCRPLPAYQLW